MRWLFVTVLVLTLAASASAQSSNFLDIVAFGTPREVQDAINQGANIRTLDFDDMTTLMSAAMWNERPAVITVLLSAGVDIAARDRTGKTAVMWAAAANPNTEVLSTLLEAADNFGHRGADTLYTRDNGHMTALMWAAWTNPNPDVISLLLERGAVVKAMDLRGKTALDYARENDLAGTRAYKALEEASR